MASQPRKRVRLGADERRDQHTAVVDLRAKIPFISHRALAAVLQIAKDETLPWIGSKKVISDSRDTRVSKRTPYGAIHQQIPLGSSGKTFEIQHPLAMLHEVCETSVAMSNLVEQLPESSPANPLALVFYTDEITPGNALSYKNQRKTWGFYWSIYQFGPAALSIEDH